jgi:hypothetical protein
VNDKGHRAIWRRFTQSAVICDLSYWTSYKIEKEEISDHFPLSICDKISRLFTIPDFVEGRVRVVDFLEEIQSPAYFLMIGNFLHMYIHPSVGNCFPTPTERPEKFSWFELRGPKSQVFVSEIISRHACPGRLISDPSVSNVRVFATVQGCDVYVADSLALDLFRSLVFAGASAIGRNDRKLLLSEFQVPQFPEDPPDRRFARLEMAKGVVSAGDEVEGDGKRLGVVVRGGFSLRLGRPAGLVRLESEMRDKKFPITVRDRPGTLELVEWRMAEDPRFS